MNSVTNTHPESGPPLAVSAGDFSQFDSGEIERFIRDSGVLLEIQKMALKANLLRLANEHGFELLLLRHDHHPVVELLLYVGNENEQGTNR